MALTIKDLSRMSGYSSATISRVLTNKSNVSAKTREDILSWIQRSGYRSAVYDTLRSTEKQNTILITVNTIGNPFYIDIIRTIQQKMNDDGYLCLVGITEDEPDMEIELLARAHKDCYAGVVLMTPTETRQLREAIEAMECPVVLVNRYLRSMETDAICVDNYRGGYIATEMLIKMGHKKICHFAGPSQSTACEERLLGYRDAMRDHGLAVTDESVYHGNLKRNSGSNFAQVFAEKGLDFTAVFFANDLMAVGFCDTLTSLGMHIPEDVSVIGFDDSSTAVQGLVRLTTVGIAPETIGFDAARVLSSRISKTNAEPPHRIVHPVFIHQRDSVKPCN